MKTVIFDLDGTLYDTSDRLDAVTPNFKTMALYPEAKEFLKRKDIQSILLTFGDHDLQVKKIDTLGISKSFKKIYIVPSNENKEEILKTILKDFPEVVPRESFVVGDRIDAEIRYGNMLGFKTVLLKQGKYKNLEPKDKWEVPLHTIETFGELSGILG